MKRNIILIYLVLFVGWIFFPYSVSGKETHAEKIIAEILNTKKSIIDSASDKSSDQYVFLAFWDFDGTILQGDSTEGLEENGRQVYKGLARMTIESGYSKIYKTPSEVDTFFKDYRRMEDIGKWLAYPFVPQMLRGADVKDICQLSSQHFKKVLSKYYFSSSIEIMKALEENNIECHIMSASADIFLKGAASTLELQEERCNGIELKIENETLTEEIIYPVTWSNGKTGKLISIVKETKRIRPGKQVFVLAAFGNSYETDGPFLEYAAKLRPPAGKTLSVMINGGKETPPEYQGLFMLVEQTETVNGE
jgi:phosphoserine phosphatase